MKRLTELDPYWLGEEFWTSAREPDDEEIDEVYERLHKYEDTGLTPEEVMELKERDTAKEPIIAGDWGIRYTDGYVCPNCDRNFTGTGVAKFCYHCGQRIKWED